MTSFLVMRFWCFKNFQMPPPKKYDNKILHVGLDDVFDTMYQGPRRHFEIGGAKNFFGVLVLIKKLVLWLKIPFF